MTTLRDRLSDLREVLATRPDPNQPPSVRQLLEVIDAVSDAFDELGDVPEDVPETVCDDDPATDDCEDPRPVEDDISGPQPRPGSVETRTFDWEDPV